MVCSMSRLMPHSPWRHRHSFYGVKKMVCSAPRRSMNWRVRSLGTTRSTTPMPAMRPTGSFRSELRRISTRSFKTHNASIGLRAALAGTRE